MKQYYERYWKKQEVLEDFSYKWPVLKKFIPKKRNISILDFGCGKGVITVEIEKINRHAKIYGVDVSEDALQICRKKLPKHMFKKIVDGGKIPFPDETFDFIIASDVLEHVYDTENAFLEISRVLKKNGKLLVSVPYNGLLKRTIIAAFFFEKIFTAYTPHIRHFTKNTLHEALKLVGLNAFKTGYYGRFYPLSNGMFVLAKK
jgi:ubiquinone/menaquinone biosynthesis C-methylase UbiE